MNFILNKIKRHKEASKLKSQIKEITQLLLAVEMNRESPEPLDTFSFPDYRWLKDQRPKEEWLEWETVGMAGKYHLRMVHQIRGTLVIVKLNDETVIAYVSDKMQRGYTGLGIQDLIYNASEIPSVLEELKATFNS